MMSVVDAAVLLRDARLRAGLSQVELGRRAGVTQSVISAYESGARQPSVPTLARLVAATGFELDLRLSEPTAVGPARGKLGHRVQAHSVELREVLSRYGLANARVFGSVARGEEGSERLSLKFGLVARRQFLQCSPTESDQSLAGVGLPRSPALAPAHRIAASCCMKLRDSL